MCVHLSVFIRVFCCLCFGEIKTYITLLHRVRKKDLQFSPNNFNKCKRILQCLARVIPMTMIYVTFAFEIYLSEFSVEQVSVR